MSEGLAQGPYVVARVGFEPATFNFSVCPEGHCASCFKRVMSTFCRCYVDVHKGEGEILCLRIWTGEGCQKS